MLQPGNTLAGYRIEAVAGVGGMGVVYRATQLSLDRPVALKVLSSTLVGNRTFRERFRREGRHAAALDHPNIIPVYEAGESNGLMFIAMRLVDGPSLADLISANQVSGREALRVVGAIASALDAAHEAGLVHRDIKPQNILLTKTGHPYLADFGITKGSGHGGLTHSGDFVGSLNYVAPEQIEGDDVTGASDIYSLAALLFHCLSGAYPYERDSDAALMHAHLRAPPPSFAGLGIPAPAGLDAVFQVGMAKLPEDRFATATGLVEACRDALTIVEPRLLDDAPAFPAPGVHDADAEPERTPEPADDPLTGPPPGSPVALPGGPRNLTAADLRRDAELWGEPERPPRRVSNTTLAIAGLVALLVVAPVAGWALGHDDPPAGPEQARSAALTLEHSAAWSRGSGDIDGLELEDPITLRRGDGVKLAAGRMLTFRAGFDPVPAALRDRFAGKSDPVTVRLGSHTAARHAVALRSRERLWLALVPDDKGWIAIACEGPGADRPGVCPAVASTLDVIAAKPVPLGPDKRLAEQIDGALTKLNAVRAATALLLRARSAATRGRAAGRSARAHAAAARTLAGLDARPQEAPLVALLAKHLRGQADNLENLSRAASRRRVIRYDSARAAIKIRERRVRAALARLRSVGYGES